MPKRKPLTYLSTFSGVGGLDLGLDRAGFQCAAQVEIDPDCRVILAEHWPGTPRFNDVRTFRGRNVGAVDLACGGFPCQDVSVAGKRKGLAGERSGLFFEFARIVEEKSPQWVAIENVTGLLSSHEGRDMGTVLGTLADLGYGWAYRVLDAQFFGVAQRRRRVVIVGCLGDAARAAEVLFEPDSVCGGPPPSRKAGARVADTLTRGAHVGSGHNSEPVEVASTLTASLGHHGYSSPRGDGSDNLIAFDTTQITSRENRSNPRPGDPCHPLTAGGHPLAITTTTAFRHHVDTGDICASEELCPPLDRAHAPAIYQCHGSNVGPMGTLRRGNGSVSSGIPSVSALTARGVGTCGADDNQAQAGHLVADPLTCRPYADGGTDEGRLIVMRGVRRLTPRECERLQGFPDDWTASMPDSTRYEMMGNAVAVPVGEWLGRRIVRAHWMRRATP